jgi:uncharacterized circularly permuted ATP-grasp superfamily protein/uncharacterized alpha-E superfamily protein
VPTQLHSSFTLSALDYAGLDARDELLHPSGQTRAHWQRFYEDPRGLNRNLAASRTARLKRGLLENALTYAITDPANRQPARPLSVDPVPLLLNQDDWSTLQEGAQQRAGLINAVLSDLYGDQTLLTQGLLPPALVLGNPDFLRPMHGIKPAGGIYLQSFAMDVTRGPDGKWWVLRDHSQATAASGFALENRILLGQLYPEMLRTLNVRRLAPFFQAQQNHLAALSGKDEPRILCYTSGPRDTRYLAQAYMARYLGYTMAEGPDLTMRNGKVYFKTLDGLKQVDVILRQVDSHLCDPLELDTNSMVGVPGLVTALRNNGVTVANAIGSGLAETGALAGFMPALSKALLGAPLSLPNMATWWCGEASAAAYVQDHFDDLNIGSAFDGDTEIVQSVLQASPEQRKALLVHSGHRIIAQERMELPTTPVQVGEQLVPAPFVLRLFVTASSDGYEVMPGGLVLSGQPGRSASTADFSPTTTKDCWVLSSKPEDVVTLLPSDEGAVKIRRTGKDLASRAADNLFWLGRYAERTEVSCRLMRSVISALTQEGQVAADPASLAAATLPLMRRAGLNSNKTKKPVGSFPDKLRRILADQTLGYGLFNCVVSVQGTAGRVRDRLSVSTFRTLQKLRDQQQALLPLASDDVDLNNALPALDDMIITLNAFAGQSLENMTRNSGWAFLDMGRRLERGLHMVESLQQLLVTMGKVRDGRLVLLLDLADSFMTYRARYMTNPMVAPVLDLLLLDETNPRSVAFQISQIDQHLSQLDGPAAPSPALSPERHLIYSLISELRLAHVEVLSNTNEKGMRVELSKMLKRFESALYDFSPLLARSYFSHAEIISAAQTTADQTQ